MDYSRMIQIEGFSFVRLSRFISKNNDYNIQNYNSPLVLYGCETWSPIVRKEHNLRVFENRVLRKTFGPKTDEVTGEWRKLRNEEFHDLCCS